MVSTTYVAVALVFLCVFGWWAHRRRVRAMFMQGTQTLATELGATQVALQTARDEKERYYLQIAEFERQRNGWHKLYIEQTIGHGNAQVLMMETIDKMGRALSDRGIKFRIPRVLHEVRAEFLETHEMPARHEAEKLGDKKPPTEPLPS